MAFFSKSLRNWTKKHDFIEGLTEWSPTEYAELTEFITEYSPTEYAECTKFTAEFFPTEYAELTEFTAEYSPTDFRCNFRGCTCLKCTNRARNTSTEQELRPLQAPSVVTFSHRTHRTHRIYCCVFSHRFHENTQIVRVQKIKTTD